MFNSFRVALALYRLSRRKVNASEHAQESGGKVQYNWLATKDH
jgi:hypothetical protein